MTVKELRKILEKCHEDAKIEVGIVNASICLEQVTSSSDIVVSWYSSNEDNVLINGKK